MVCFLNSRKQKNKANTARALGGRRQQFQDVTTFRKVSVDYTVAAAQAFIAYLAYRLPAGKKFRFVYCSGKSAEWDQTKKLSFMEETRKVKVRLRSTASNSWMHP